LFREFVGAAARRAAERGPAEPREPAEEPQLAEDRVQVRRSG
jgi:hypothetical protein